MIFRWASLAPRSREEWKGFSARRRRGQSPGRRSMAGAAGLAARPDFRIGSLTVKPGECAVKGEAGPVHLEPRVMQVLIALHEARGTTLTRDRLIETCWGRIVGDDALNRVIIQIRKIA